MPDPSLFFVSIPWCAKWGGANKMMHNTCLTLFPLRSGSAEMSCCQQPHHSVKPWEGCWPVSASLHCGTNLNRCKNLTELYPWIHIRKERVKLGSVHCAVHTHTVKGPFNTCCFCNTRYLGYIRRAKNWRTGSPNPATCWPCLAETACNPNTIWSFR